MEGSVNRVRDSKSQRQEERNLYVIVREGKIKWKREWETESYVIKREGEKKVKEKKRDSYAIVTAETNKYESLIERKRVREKGEGFIGCCEKGRSKWVREREREREIYALYKVSK